MHQPLEKGLVVVVPLAKPLLPQGLVVLHDLGRHRAKPDIVVETFRVVIPQLERDVGPVLRPSGSRHLATAQGDVVPQEPLPLFAGLGVEQVANFLIVIKQCLKYLKMMLILLVKE